jgi:hypothetical protein
LTFDANAIKDATDVLGDGKRRFGNLIKEQDYD